MHLDELKEIKRWQLAHRDSHPVEYRLWDAMLMVWLMGWIGWLPAMVLGTPWVFPACVLAIAMPDLYAGWRARAHHSSRLRCDWLRVIPQSLASRSQVRR